ncbi:hypothetical protein JMUB7507_26460 [Staphylococcus aureus]
MFIRHTTTTTTVIYYGRKPFLIDLTLCVKGACLPFSISPSLEEINPLLNLVISI